MSQRDESEVGAEPGYAALLDADTQDLYENAPCGYLSTLLDGTIVKLNSTFLRWTGYRREELVGRRRFQDLLTPGGRIYYETHYAPLLRMQRAVREIALDLVCAGDRRLPILVNSVVRGDPDTGAATVRTMVFDATERREYERELLRARERAERSEARVRALAQTLQRSFIPPALPAVPGLDLAGVYRPAGEGDEVGGDFYDVFQRGRGDWAIVVGDVCGKGAEAATITALARYTLRAAAMQTARPRSVLVTLNRALVRERTERFCTVAYARVRTRASGAVQLTVASGGHPLPVRVTRAGTGTLGRPGSLLGALDDVALGEDSVELEAGDVVAFYTDGVTEGRRGLEFFGEERLYRTLFSCREQGASAIARRVVDEVVDFQGGLPQDDIALVVLRVPDAS